DGLHICRLDNFETVMGWIPLWKGGRNQSVLAAAPDGKHLAVAGNDEHDIAVFAIQDLLKKKPEPWQTIHSSGAAVRCVSFVRRGDNLGLLLSEKGVKAPGAIPRAPRDGDMIFDPTRRDLTPYKPGEWQASVAPLGGWAARFSPAKKDKRGE